MPSASGINATQIGKDSLLRSRRDFYFAPIAATTNYIVASIDPSTSATVGTAFTLATAANGKMFRRARAVTMTLTDASGGAGGLTITVQIVGQRWGQNIIEQLTVTCTDGSATTGTSANVYDQVISITPITSVSTAATGDALVCGISGTIFGLDFPIDAVADVQILVNTSTNTEAAATASPGTSTNVVPGPGAGKSFIQAITLATTDRWEVRYLASTIQDFGDHFGIWR